MAARMRAVQVTRMLKTLAHLPSGAHVPLGPLSLAPTVFQQSSASRCRRSASTESFAWSVGSEPGSSTGAPPGSGSSATAAGGKPRVLGWVALKNSN